MMVYDSEDQHAQANGRQRYPAHARSFDLIVVGSTLEGIEVAEAAAKLGARVALIDHDPTGRRCDEAWRFVKMKMVNWWRTSRKLGLSDVCVRDQARSQFKNALFEADDRWRAFLWANSAPISFTEGPARFVARDRLLVGRDTEMRGRAFVLATGSRPRSPKTKFGAWASDAGARDLLRRGRIPRSLAIIGADWVGCEWAFVSACQGSAVRLIDRRTRLLRTIDSEIRILVQENLHSMGVEIALGEEISGVTRDDHGAVRISLSSGRTEIVESALVLAGDLGNTHGLELPTAGVATDVSEHVLIDDRGRTSVGSIFAIGPVVDSSGMLEPTRGQAQCVARNALGDDISLSSASPLVLSTFPFVAVCGLNAESCKRLGISVVVGIGSGKHDAIEPELMHLVVERGSTRVLGVQIAGPDAHTLLSSIAESVTSGENMERLIQRLTRSWLPLGLTKSAVEHARFQLLRV